MIKILETQRKEFEEFNPKKNKELSIVYAVEHKLQFEDAIYYAFFTYYDSFELKEFDFDIFKNPHLSSIVEEKELFEIKEEPQFLDNNKKELLKEFLAKEELYYWATYRTSL